MVSVLSDLGIKRNLNEDYASYLETNDFKIYVVADGMGGHNAGEVASKIATEGIIDFIEKNFKSEDKNNILEKAIEKVNNDIFNLAKNKEEYNGMGTTITACLQFENRIIIANVGDSSCFGLKNKCLEKLTKDHSLVQELLDLGTISEEEAENHPKKNIITRAVGTSDKILVDIFALESNKYDFYILCSDGLTNEVSKDSIASTIYESDNLDSASKKLIELARLNGGRDNITVLLFGGEN